MPGGVAGGTALRLYSCRLIRRSAQSAKRFTHATYLSTKFCRNLRATFRIVAVVILVVERQAADIEMLEFEPPSVRASCLLNESWRRLPTTIAIL